MSAAVLVFKLFDEGAAFYTLHMVSVEEYAPSAAFSLAFKADDPPSWERSPSLQIGLRDFKSRMQSRMTAWSKCPLGSAPARLLRLLGARLAALGSSVLPERAGPLGSLHHCLGCTS